MPTYEIVIRPKRGLVPINFRELWQYRQLILFLVWRDILVRYKQTAIGIAWALLQPLAIMAVFTIIFGQIAKFPSHDAPYVVMTFAALLPWQFFANAISFSSNSLIASQGMITKVYFPRLVIPTSSTISGILDFAISFVILLGLMVWYQVPFRSHLFLLPVYFLLGFAAALGVGLWLSALNVKYRDVKYAVPFLVHIGIYISPVGFMSGVIPENWRFCYSLNPMVGVIDGFRWAILGPMFEPYWPGFCAGAMMSAVVLMTGAYFFRFTEKTFADVI